jgi:hypothetical protein
MPSPAELASQQTHLSACSWMTEASPLQDYPRRMGVQRLLRKRASVSVIAALAIACAACSPSAAGHSAASEPPPVSLSHHAPLPGCRTTTAAAPRLSSVHTALRRVGPSPFGVVVTAAVVAGAGRAGDRRLSLVDHLMPLREPALLAELISAQLAR